MEDEISTQWDSKDQGIWLSGLSQSRKRGVGEAKDSQSEWNSSRIQKLNGGEWK